MSHRREKLLKEIERLADHAVFGSLSETFRTCGNTGCRCHGPGPKHGPHMYISYRGEHGKTTGFYVPTAAQQKIRDGLAAWQTLQTKVRELALLNKEEIFDQARQKKRSS